MILALVLLYLGNFLVAVRTQTVNLSPCALGCGIQSILAAGCSIQNTTCQCESKSLPQLTGACLLANCTMADSLAVARFVAQQCNLPFQDNSKIVLGAFVTIISTTGVIVFIRVGSKLVNHTIALEDYAVFLALMLAVGADVIVSIFSHEGFGRHLSSLGDGQLLKVLRYFYIAENIYPVSLGLTKLSILLFYLRIFQHQWWFRVGVHITICVVVISTAIISVFTIFPCQPVQYFWNRDIKNGACLNITALAYANSGMSIAQDIMIIILPIPVVFDMIMATKKKLGVAFMFAVGGFGCIVSIIRLRSLLVFGVSLDPTWDYVPVTIWTALELAAGMICSSLPALRTLAQKVFSRFNFSFLASKSSSGSGCEPVDTLRLRLRPQCFAEMVHIERGTLDIKWNGDTQELENVQSDHGRPRIFCRPHH